MKNFVQRGDVITLPAPVGGIVAGQGLIVGAIFGIATTDAAAGELVECALTGVFDLPKLAGAIYVGDTIWFDADSKKVAAASDPSRLFIGAAIESAGEAAPTARVRLNGIFGELPDEGS